MDLQQLIQTAWEQASQNEFFQGGFLLGLLAWMGMQLKSIPMDIWSRIERRIKYVVYMDNTNDMYTAFSSWFYDKYPKSFKRVEAKLNRQHDRGNLSFSLRIRQYTDFNFIRYRKRWIFIKKDKETLEGARDQSSRYVETYNIVAFFGRKIITEMMSEVEDYWNNRHAGEIGIRAVITDKWANERTIYVTSYKKIDSLFFEGKKDLLNDLNNFMSKQSIYRKAGIKFKRGYMLYGPPGTGKTSIVFAVADIFDMPIYYLNPSGFGDDDSFEEFVSGVEPWSIILIEDVDIFFQGRDDRKTNVSFQSLLNVLDGLHSPDNVLIFMTTNRPDKFDEAFMRKGRLDYKLYIGHPKKNDVESFLSNFYEKDSVNLKSYSNSKAMVDIQDLCIKNDYLTVLNILENE